MEENEQGIRRIIDALVELEHCAEWKDAEMDVDAEITKVGMGAKRTGRSILTIKVPYIRDERFLQRQLTLLDEQMESLETLKSLATDEYMSIQDELNDFMSKQESTEST